MQTIITRYLSATNTRPARIKAQATNGQKLTISQKLTGTDDDHHATAAVKLAGVLGWTGEMVAGHLKGGGLVWVFLDPISPHIIF